MKVRGWEFLEEYSKEEIQTFRKLFNCEHKNFDNIIGLVGWVETPCTKLPNSTTINTDILSNSSSESS